MEPDRPDRTTIESVCRTANRLSAAISDIQTAVSVARGTEDYVRYLHLQRDIEALWERARAELESLKKGAA